MTILNMKIIFHRKKDCIKNGYNPFLIHNLRFAENKQLLI